MARDARVRPQAEHDRASGSSRRAALIINAASSPGRALPEIIRALSDRKTARIKVTADARTQVLRTQARIQLAQDGTDPEKFPQAGRDDTAPGHRPGHTARRPPPQRRRPRQAPHRPPAEEHQHKTSQCSPGDPVTARDDPATIPKSRATGTEVTSFPSAQTGRRMTHLSVTGTARGRGHVDVQTSTLDLLLTI